MTTDPRKRWAYCPSDPGEKREYLTQLLAFRDRCGWESQNDRREVVETLERLESER